MPQMENSRIQAERESLEEKIENRNSNLIENDLSEDTGSVKEAGKTDAAEINKPGKGLRFLNSIAKNGSFIKKAAKGGGIGLAIGFGIGMLFPPLGIAIMAISAIAMIAAIGSKIGYSYANSKSENHYTRSNEEKAEMIEHLVEELIEKRLSKNKEKSELAENKYGIGDAPGQNSEEFIRDTRRKEEHTIENAMKNRIAKDYINDQKLPFDSSMIVGEAHNSVRNSRESVLNVTDRAKLEMFTKPLNSLNPSIKQDRKASKSKGQKEESQSTNRFKGVRLN